MILGYTHKKIKFHFIKNVKKNARRQGSSLKTICTSERSERGSRFLKKGSWRKCIFFILRKIKFHFIKNFLA